MAPSTSTSAAISLLARVRETCEAQLQHSDAAVYVNDERVAEFVEQLDWEQYAQLAEPHRFPLKFKSLEDEVNFFTLYAMLNFGSGYRKDLHKYCERGAAETILFGLIGMYISVPQLNAAYLANMSIDVLANYFSLPLDRDEEISTGIYVSKPGPLRPFAEMIHTALTESAEKLLQLKMDNFGTFVLANTRAASDQKPSAAYLVEKLVSTFPAFDDHRTSRDGRDVYFLKRAQLAASSVYARFHETNEDLQFDDIKELTVFTDNVLPCVLRALGILEYDPDLAALIDRGEELPAGDRECDIRAGAVVAGERIVAASQGRLTTHQLDIYLWRVGKEPRFRGLERHATRGTFFY